MITLLRWIAAPFDNPVLRREIKLVTRRGRIEWVLLMLTVAMTLLIASIGGKAGMHPAQVGKVLFQTFFGIAQGLVLLAGPAVAASSIASEREGRTYEALMLTGMPPARVAWGKFVASLANVGAYVIALAPVGALPFLFGGVSALAVLFAFAMLCVSTVLAVLLGLAISARLPTTRAALITSVIAGASAAVVLHTLVGESVGNDVCRAMGMQRPGTIWWPVLLAEGDLSAEQIAALLAVPFALATMLGWFLFEVCVANLSDPSDDRTTGIKRWFSASVALLAPVACVPVILGDSLSERATAAIESIALYVAFAIFAAFVFQGDAVITPRRVRMRWSARKTSILRRFFGPGITASAALQLLAGVVVLGTIVATTLACAVADEFRPPDAPLAVVVLSAPAGMFVFFAVGLSTWLRVRWGTKVGRWVLAIVLLVVCVAPYALSAILGNGQGTPDTLAPLLAAPSPIFAYHVAHHIATGQAASEEVLASLLCAVGYTVIGIVTLASAILRADKELRERDADAARMDALIAAEDALENEKLAGVAGPAPTVTMKAAPASLTEPDETRRIEPLESSTRSDPARDDTRWMPPEERFASPRESTTAPGFATMPSLVTSTAPRRENAAAPIPVSKTPVATARAAAEPETVLDPIPAPPTLGCRDETRPEVLHAPHDERGTLPHGTLVVSAQSMAAGGERDGDERD